MGLIVSASPRDGCGRGLDAEGRHGVLGVFCRVGGLSIGSVAAGVTSDYPIIFWTRSEV